MTIRLNPNELVDVSGIEDIERKLGLIFRHYRRALDLTQAEVEARSGLKQSAICKFETHESVTLKVFLRYSQGLQLLPSAILRIAEEPEAFEEARALGTRFFG